MEEKEIKTEKIGELKNDYKKKGKALLFIIGCTTLVTIVIIVVALLLTNNKKIIISFDTDGAKKVSSIKINKGNSVKLPNIEKNGFEFGGWYLNDEKVTDLTKFTKNETLKAKWIVEVAKTFKITFDSNGGSMVESIVLECGKELFLPANPTKDGYSFVSWIDENENPILDKTLLTCENITLKAKWNKEETKKEEIKKKETKPSDNINKKNNNQANEDIKKENYLSFDDIYFENYLRNQLQLTGGSKISEYDMLQLTSLTIGDSVSDISGIKFAKNLTSVSLDSDITSGLDELSSLPNLTRISLGFWKKLNIDFLKDLNNITYIYFNNPTVTGGSLSSICSGKKLKELFYYSPTDRGIEFLSECTNLEKLELIHAFDNNDDISVLLSLNKLKYIEILSYIEYSPSQDEVFKQLISRGVTYKKL